MLEIDRDQVRLLVVQHGVRETARILGLPMATVAAWSARGDWLKPAPVQSLPRSMVQAPASGAINVAQKALAAYQEDRLQTRLGASRVVRRAVQTLERKDDDELLVDGGQTIKTVVQSAAIVHGWADQSPGKVVISLAAMESMEQMPMPEADTPDVGVIDI